MTSIAPQDPEWSATEILRGATLGLKGVMVNSQTQGEYLDDPKFDPIFRALAETGQPLYLHPATPPDAMIGPMLDGGLDGAIFGFAVETGMHLLRLITGGIFDRYPGLQIMVGHAGEALPFWLYCLDFVHQAGVRSKRCERMKPLKKTITVASPSRQEARRFSTPGGHEVVGVPEVRDAVECAGNAADGDEVDAPGSGYFGGGVGEFS